MIEAGRRLEGDVRADAGHPLGGREGHLVVLGVVQPERRNRVAGEQPVGVEVRDLAAPRALGGTGEQQG